MKNVTRSVRVATSLIILNLMLAAPASASAFWDGFPFGSPDSAPSAEQVNKLPIKLCERTISAAGISIKVKLPSKKCDTPPPPTDLCPNVPGTQTSTPCADQECVEDGGTWDGDSCNFPEPPDPTLDFDATPSTILQGATSTLTWDSNNADTCTASNGWNGSKPLQGSEIVSPSATTTYSLECVGDGGTTTESVVVNVTTSPPPPPEGKLLITEVIYDLSEGQGSEPSNEWVELYNGTNSTVDLTGYSIANNNGSDVLPGAVSLPAGAYLLIIATGNPTSTLEFWNEPGSAVIVTLPNATVGGGLTNTAGFVELRNAASTTIDMVAWGETGTTTPGFGEVVPDVAAGHSIARSPVTIDTDTNNDWVDRETPTPGE